MVRSICAAALMLLSAGSLPAVSIVVSPDGNDATGDGTAVKPFATIARAAEALPAEADRRILLRGGVYELASPVVLRGTDRLTIEPETPDPVTLTAGRRIRALTPLEDAEVISKLPAAVAERVRVADLAESGISNLGEMSGGFGQAGSTGVEFFCDTIPMIPARYPNTGFIRITQALGATAVDIRGTKGTKEGVIRVDDPHLPGWAGDPGVMVNGYWFWDWADQRLGVKTIDPATGVMTLDDEVTAFGFRDGQWFYVFNALSELDAPGEWYLDREKSMAYLLLPDGASATNPAVSATLLDHAIILEDCSNVTLRGLTIEGARKDAVVIRNGSQVRVESCEIRNSGGNGVTIDGGTGCAVVATNLHGLGDGGVVLRGGDRATLTPGGHSVESCQIHHYSRWNRTYHPGVSLDGVAHRVAANRIHSAPHQAIALQGNDMLIEHNLIERVCQETTDAGAIYGWNDWASRGHVIRYNVLRNITGLNDQGANGVYLDDNFAAAEVYGNLFDNVDDGVLHGGGQDSVYRDNVFIDCRVGIKIDARGLDWRTFGKDELVQKLELWPYKQEPWKSRYPTLVNLLGNEPMTPKGTIVRNNRSGGNGRFLQINDNAKPYITVEGNQTDLDPAELRAAAKP